MKRRNVIYRSAMFVLIVAVLLVWPTPARENTGHKKEHCKDTEKHPEMMQRCEMMMAAPIYLDSPAVIYGQAEMLKLSVEQKEQLKKIENEARKKALAILTPEQLEKLGELPAKPVTLARLCGTMLCCKGGHGTTVCQKQTKTCPMGCTKPCCAAKKQLDAVEQTTCPVMGGAINKNIYTEYKGKKVYYCCPGCKPEFEKNPEKYVGKLPQFKK